MKKPSAQLECPYCASPRLFDEPPISAAIQSKLGGSLVHAVGKFWRRSPKLHPRVRNVPTMEFKSQMRAHINGEKQFGGAFQAYDVDLVGVGFNKRPPLAPGPFFHRSGPIKYGPGAKPQGPTYLSYNGCRITHRETGITVDVHWWMTHGLIATLKNLPSGQVKNGIAIAQKALGFFAMERRGNPKIGEETISTALQKLGPEATQREIAQELKVTERGLEKWRERHGFSTWDEVKARYV